MVGWLDIEGLGSLCDLVRNESGIVYVDGPVVGEGDGCGGSPVAVSSTVIGGGESDLERLRLLMMR